MKPLPKLQIALSLLKQNPNEVPVLLGDKSYDDREICSLAREEGVRPLIKHRDFSSLHKAWNARLDTDLYGRRSQNETVNSRLERKYGSFVRSRHWWKQFREVTLVCLVYNLNKMLYFRLTNTFGRTVLAVSQSGRAGGTEVDGDRVPHTTQFP